MARTAADFATGKPVDPSKPEERVRQEYERVLVDAYGYENADLDIEVRIPRGSGFFPDKADIVVYHDTEGRDPAQHIFGIVETKRPARRDGIAQVKSYMTATSAEWGVWTNGSDIAYLGRDGHRIRDDYLNNIPARGQRVTDVGRLIRADLRPFDRSELKAAFRRILSTLYANTNIGRREKLGSEMIKIIFSKLEDERSYATRPPDFRAEAGESPAAVAHRVEVLFRRVKEDLRDDGIFAPHDEIQLDSRSVAWVVGQLERGSLLTTESDVVGDAFEVFSESKFVGEKGEFFTPRGVVKVAVKLVDPQPTATLCDPACGSGGFLIHAMKHMWERMRSDPRWQGAADIEEQKRRIAAKSFFGIDKETDLVKISKAHMAIAGDGRSNIVHENALHRVQDFEGDAARHFRRRVGLRHFDAILTNPPFGTKTKVLAQDAVQFDLGHSWSAGADGTWSMKQCPRARDPYILFIERCLNMLRPGGKLGIVLPESVFHGEKLGYVRQFILRHGIVAIIDLPHNTFRPHCNAKTCLMVLRKAGGQPDRVIMATPQEMGHDLQGRRLYRPGSEEVWDDLKVVLRELDDPDLPTNEHVFTVPWGEIDTGALVPRFYRARMNPPQLPEGCQGVTLADLQESGTVSVWNGHGSPPGEAKGRGQIPYIRASDIVNWEMYRNPVAMIPREVYLKKLGNREPPAAGDIIFVRRGSYRIGTVAMASPRDTEVLLMRELLTIRVAPNNAHGISPYYLLAMLSTEAVQNQLPHYVFIDTTLPNIGDRWKRLVIPVHTDRSERDHIGAAVERSIREKWSAQERIDALRNSFGKITT